MRKNKTLYIAIILLVTIIILTVFAPVIAPYKPNLTNISNKLQGFSKNHLLGTDALGRDMLSRILYGGRISILISLIAVIISMFFGIIMGGFSGYYGGITDKIITGITNIFQGLPGLTLMIAIAGTFGSNIGSLILALSINSWAGFSRIIRTEVLKTKEEPFIESMRCLGSSDLSILFKHIFPNIFGNIIVLFTTRISSSIISISSLNFIGLGIRPPTPDWSVMINDARMYYRSSPHLIIIPGFVIFLLLLSINIIGDALRDKLDVKNKEIREY